MSEVGRFQRSFKEALVRVNSVDASINGNQDYSFTFKNNPISDAKSIQVYSYSIPWSWVNVSKYTNTLLFKEGSGAPITVTLPVGNYSVYDIQTTLATLMTAGGNQTYTVSYDTVANKISISAPSTVFTILFVGTTFNFLIGLTANLVSSGISNSLTFQNGIDLLPQKLLEIKLPDLIQSTTSSNTIDPSLIHLVSLGGYAYGDTLREIASGIELDIIKKDLTNMTVSIVAQDGYTPQFDEAQPFEIIFRVVRL